MATTVLCEIRDVRKRQIFLQMSAEIEDLKKKLTKALDFAEHYQKRSKSLALENDWLHSLTNTPAVSPAKQIVGTLMNLDEISEQPVRVRKKKNRNLKMKIQASCLNKALQWMVSFIEKIGAFIA